MDTSRNILVTGASGFVGAQLVPLLLQRGHRVTVVTRSPEHLQRHAWSAVVTIVVGDLTDANICEQAVVGMDVVLHLAGLAHVGASAEQHRQHNYLATQRLAQAAQRASVQVFVYLSSCKARYPAHSAYGYYKLASERFLLAQTESMRVVCLRPGVIYGQDMRNNLRTLWQLLQRPVLPVFVGSTNTLCMIGVGDCCRAVVAAMEQSALAGQAWDLTDGERYTLNALVGRIRQARQLPLPWLNLPAPLVWPVFALASLIPALRRRGLGLNTWRALFRENYPVDNRFAEASGVWPATTLYQIMPNLSDS
ncbi:MAG TPA: NAD(P)-dependent oxidoreductase [Candidatus Acidoferrum sp.]|nr:NAD(P)-dependent oxidoreductase [Candidatus Acidoferrum sp.]